MRRLASFWLSTVALWGQATDPAYKFLDKAYEALRNNRFEEAITAFHSAIDLDAARASTHKDLAYTLLKVGETEAARDQFAVAMHLDPADDHVALEYAFLCYDTKQPVIARRIFDQLRKKENETAAQAFENVDRPLREGIERWKRAIEISPDNFSAHEELAHLAEQRDELDLASEHYQKSWNLKPERRDLLLDMGRVWKELNRIEDSHAALLAASRGAEPRVAEQAHELLPTRYPYVYEFENALALDPTNNDLRRELAYLHLAMGNREAADHQFELLPDSTNSSGNFKQQPQDAKEMADKSYEKGYMNDALRYLQLAHETDPTDFEVMLKLGRTYNVLKDDSEAVRWFDLARQSPDPKIADEASHSYNNLESGLRRFGTTMWSFPVISTRWKDAFTYAQAKTELRLPIVHPYLSFRFVGDARGALKFRGAADPQYLSERSVIAAVGLATTSWRGVTTWFEAGESLHYQSPTPNSAWALPDFRGGISFSKSIHLPHEWFGETNDDGVFVSRFDHDTLLYSQNRIGKTLNNSIKLYWNWNATIDAKREYWGNTIETGPGVRFRFEAFQLSVDFLRGVYLINAENPYRPNFNDIRIGLWYAHTR